MKNLFYVLAAGFLLASCTKDTTCTCTYDAVEGMPTPVATVSECIGCDSDEREAFEAVCTSLDALMNIPGVTAGSCVID